MIDLMAMQTPFDAIIFDSDGTLVDSEHLACETLVEHAALFDIAMTVEEVLSRFKGGRLADFTAHLEERRGRSLPTSFEHDVRKRMAEILESRLQPVDGAMELIRSLKVPFCVASNGPREKIELCLRVTGLLPYFEGRIFSAYEVGFWKPEPQLFIHAARALGASPTRCAVVEDSTPGLNAGLAAGMTVFALPSPSSSDPLPPGVEAIPGLRVLIDRFAR
jgi:HAD superfamily hydrolase (TIGR01509 family)